MDKTRNPLTVLSIIGGVAILGGFIWWLVFPFILNRTVDDVFPVDATLAAVKATDEALAAEMGNNLMDEPMPIDINTAIVLTQGAFYNVAHEGMGTATIYELPDGSRILRFEEFEVLNGPQLHVWLVGDDPVAETVGVEPEVYIDLGRLRGNIGNQNYALPDDLDLSPYKSVVIWCVPFQVGFNAAPLTPVGQ